MAPALIVVTAVIYAFVAVDMLNRGNWPLSLTFAAYAISNVGLFFAAR
jgi:hypothetical protein